MGLGSWFEDIVGKENIDAARNAYQGSRLSDTVRVADDVIGSLGHAYNRSQELDEAMQAKAEAQAYENATGRKFILSDEYNRLKSEDVALEDNLVPVIGIGSLGRGAIKSANKLGKQLRRQEIDPTIGNEGQRLKQKWAGEMANKRMRDLQIAKRNQSISDVGLQNRVEQEMANRGDYIPSRYLGTTFDNAPVSKTLGQRFSPEQFEAAMAERALDTNKLLYGR